MPRPVYTRKHQVLLQVIMWVVFGLCMGMAQFVTSHHRSAYRVTLSDPVHLGPFTVRVPQGWTLNPPSKRGNIIVLEVFEPRGKMKSAIQRHLTFFFEPLKEPMFPQAYLQSQPLIGYDDSGWFGDGSGGGREANEFEQTEIDGRDAVMAMRVRRPRAMLAVLPPQAEMFGCAVVEDRGAFVVRYVCDPAASPGDRALFQQILGGVSLTAK